MSVSDFRPQQSHPCGTLNSGTILVYLQSYNREDDVLQINRLKSGGYRAVFKNYTVGRVFEQYFEDDVLLLRYLDTFMLIQQVDTHPYAFIQLDLPGMPAVVMRPSKIAWDSIYNLVKKYLEDISQDSQSWPREYSLSAYRQRYARSLETLNVN